MTTRRHPPSWRSWSSPTRPSWADDLGELRRLGREVEESVAAGAVLRIDGIEPAGERVEGGRVGEIHPVVREALGEGPPHRVVDGLDPAELLERCQDLRPERIVVVGAATDGQDHELMGEQVRPPQLVEGRDDLAMGEVAGRAHQDEDGWIRDPLEAEALAQHVGRRLRPRRSLGLPGQA